MVNGILSTHSRLHWEDRIISSGFGSALGAFVGVVAGIVAVVTFSDDPAMPLLWFYRWDHRRRIFWLHFQW